MPSISDTLVKLPNSRNAIVIPSPWWQPGRVLKKMRRSKKRSLKVNECTLIRSNL
ncbi:hypothetical protein I8752_15350 [Nostocaceae cyanobacterium CENA369]|uniref:Uncharacterized protein n=1 Tax=Dendronalium phyllosphericum CENA369 TaxID=1725256 RepID=A0A8J7I723_9NOST|nr:hypothetical protein [Dendronalium phyllosphericum]MBH8574371.1 hypothetical protein [Dendronalium phyllosphericum CENA369]